MRRPVYALLVLVACGDHRPASPDAVEPAPDAALIDATLDGDLDARTGAAPAVILLIGDGMGPGQLDAASQYRFGARGRLAMQALPYRGAGAGAAPMRFVFRWQPPPRDGQAKD